MVSKFLSALEACYLDGKWLPSPGSYGSLQLTNHWASESHIAATSIKTSVVFPHFSLYGHSADRTVLKKLVGWSTKQKPIQFNIHFHLIGIGKRCSCEIMNGNKRTNKNTTLWFIKINLCFFLFLLKVLLSIRRSAHITSCVVMQCVNVQSVWGNFLCLCYDVLWQSCNVL